MDVEDAIRTRRAVRSYADREVDRETIVDLFESARLAPSAHNDQPWRFVIVTDADRREQLYHASFEQDVVASAPVIVAGISTTPDDELRCGLPTGPINLAIALDHVTLRATELGLGTCWIGSFDQQAAKAVLDVPPNWQVIELLTLGYPTGDFEAVQKDRKPLEEILDFETCNG